ncbi:ATP-binding protein [Leptolyngbya sp. AN02str]|uniref:ATP-binding protein n=1 Tax=Leptolyngbya sp. AN02str TaxID=3423363 RepID=UPI003D3115F5
MGNCQDFCRQWHAIQQHCHEEEFLLQRREQYLEMLLLVQQCLLQLPDTESPYEACLAWLGKASGAARVAVWEMCGWADDCESLQLCAEWHAETMPEFGHGVGRWPLTRQPRYIACPTAVAQGHVVNMGDRYVAEIAQDLPLTFGTRAVLLLPLLVQEQVHGLVQFDSTSEPYPWTQTEVSFLSLAIAAIAKVCERRLTMQQLQQQEKELRIYRDRLEELVVERTAQLQRSLQYEAALRRVTDRVRDSLNEQQILYAAVRELSDVLTLDCCDAGIYDAELTTSTILYEHAPHMPTALGTVIALANHEALYRPLLKRESLQICQIAEMDVRRVSQRYAILVCPIFDDQEVFGDIWLYRSADEVFGRQEVRFVEQVASQCAIALRQSRLYQAVQAQVASLEMQHRLKDDFLATASHELRSPITNMKMAIQVLAMVLNRTNCLDEADPSADVIDDPTSQYLRILDRECQHEINLINDLLDLQRLNAGSHLGAIEPVDLAELLSIVADSFQERLQARQLTFELKLAPNLPNFCCDAVALNRIATELMNNACKYTPPNGSVELLVLEQADQIHILVTNVGVEIPANELPHIFDKFYRVANGDRWQQGGTGLGLTLVKELVKFLGGEIEVCSSNHRTQFLVKLPFTALS